MKKILFEIELFLRRLAKLEPDEKRDMSSELSEYADYAAGELEGIGDKLDVCTDCGKDMQTHPSGICRDCWRI